MLTMTELAKIVEHWVKAEDDPAVIEAVVKDVINEMETEIDQAKATKEMKRWKLMKIPMQ